MEGQHLASSAAGGAAASRLNVTTVVAGDGNSKLTVQAEEGPASITVSTGDAEKLNAVLVTLPENAKLTSINEHVAEILRGAAVEGGAGEASASVVTPQF
mgnify:CR=1 FL=1